MISKCSFFSPTFVFTLRSSGIIAGGAPSLPVTAVRWSPVMVPMEPPTFTIFVEARSEESVVSTRLRAIGIWTSPRFKNGCPQDRKSTRLNSSHGYISYAVFCLKKKNYHLTSPRRSDHQPTLSHDH